MRGYSFKATVAAVIVGGLVAGSRPAAALSFTIPNGATIERIVFTTGPTIASYDIDSPENLFIEDPRHPHPSRGRR